MGSSRSAGDDGREIRIGGQAGFPPLSPSPAPIKPNQEMGLFGVVVKVVVDYEVFGIQLIAKYKRLEKRPIVYKMRNTTFRGSIGELQEYDKDSGCIVQFHCTTKLPIEVQEGELLWFVREIADDDDENVAVAQQNQERRSVLSPVAAPFFPGSVTYAGSGSSSNVIPQPQVYQELVIPPGGGFPYPWSPVVPLPYYQMEPPQPQVYEQMVIPRGGGFLYPLPYYYQMVPNGMFNNYPSPGNLMVQALMQPPNQPIQIGGNQYQLPDSPESESATR